MKTGKKTSLVEQRLSKSLGLPVRLIPAKLRRRDTSNLILFKKKQVVVSPSGGRTAAASSDDKEPA